MSRPVLGVVASGTTEAARPLVRALARHVEVRALDRSPGPVAVAALAVGADAVAPAGLPVARVDAGAVSVGDTTVALPTGTPVDTASLPPLAPHVRRRWRQRLGLPPVLVVDTAALVLDDVPTALAVAAAAVVDEPHLPLALALGCPTVTSADAAARLGVTDVVVVGERAEAEALAGDDHRAARLSRQGRAAAVARLDAAAAADAVVAALGLGPAPTPAVLADARMAELGTAPAAPIRRRVAAGLALFTAPGGP